MRVLHQVKTLYEHKFRDVTRTQQSKKASSKDGFSGQTSIVVPLRLN